MKFRYDWFSGKKGNFAVYLKKFKGKPNLRFLEIGPFEGMATLWLLENILTGPDCNITCIDTFEGNCEHKIRNIDISNLFDIFIGNIEKYEDRVTIIKGKSQEELRKDELRFPIYDFIYIDGSHKASDVLEDVVLGFRLLKKEGIMIFDDYEWKFLGRKKYDIDSPRIAIDTFLSVFEGQYRLLSKGRQVIIEKI
jgi:predicted O-methyltransferase YrrM